MQLHTVTACPGRAANLLFQRWLLLPCRSMTKALADLFFGTKAAVVGGFA